MSERSRAGRAAGRLRSLASRALGRPAPVEAGYAGLLDGRRLWLALPPGTGEVALVGPAGGVLALADELADEPDHDTTDAPTRRAVRLDLTPVMDMPPGSYAVVAGDSAAPVSLPEEAWSRVAPTGPAGGERLRLERHDNGTLAICVRPPQEGRPLKTVGYQDGRAVLGCAVGPEGVAESLVLLDEGGKVTAELRTKPVDGLLMCTLAHTDLPPTTGTYPVAVGSDRHPVIRDANSLDDAGSVLLPFVVDGEDQVAGRLRFRPDGRLIVRRLPTQTERPG